MNTAVTPKPRCFIAMPISTPEAYHRKSGGKDHFIQVLHGIMKPAAEAAGYEAVEPIVPGSEVIQAALIRNLHECDMVLGDLTANNPNVFFELGIRACFNKPFCFVRDKDDEAPFPFDISSFNVHQYDSSLMPTDLARTVAAVAEHLCKAKGQTDNAYWRTVGIGQKLEGTLPATAEGGDAILAVLGEIRDTLQVQSRRLTALESEGEPTTGLLTHCVTIRGRERNRAYVDKELGNLAYTVDTGEHIFFRFHDSVSQVERKGALRRLASILNVTSIAPNGPEQ